MLSAIIVSSPVPAGRPRAVGAWMRTLAALVPATVDGIVRDVALLNLPDDEDIAALAEEAGCQVVGGSDFAEALGRAVSAARSMSLFVLKAGTVPSRLFGEEVVRSLDRRPGTSGSLVLRGESSGPLSRILPGCLAPVAGVILPRARLASARCRTFAEVVRRARPAKPLPSHAAVRP